MTQPSVPAAAESVFDFWLGELDEHGLASSDKSKAWWKKSAAILAGRNRDRLDTPRGTLATVIWSGPEKVDGFLMSQAAKASVSRYS